MYGTTIVFIQHLYLYSALLYFIKIINCMKSSLNTKQFHGKDSRDLHTMKHDLTGVRVMLEGLMGVSLANQMPAYEHQPINAHFSDRQAAQ